jgi:MraZ protein
MATKVIKMGDTPHHPQPPKVEPLLGMYPGRLDDRGRLKLPANFLQHFASLGETQLFVTSLDRRIARLYTIPDWRETEKWLVDYHEDTESADNIAFNAADLGAVSDIDSQGRILFSTDLRRALEIENQPVRLWPNGNKIEVLSDKIYQERKSGASVDATKALRKLEQAGMPR